MANPLAVSSRATSGHSNTAPSGSTTGPIRRSPVSQVVMASLMACSAVLCGRRPSISGSSTLGRRNCRIAFVVVLALITAVVVGVTVGLIERRGSGSPQPWVPGASPSPSSSSSSSSSSTGTWTPFITESASSSWWSPTATSTGSQRASESSSSNGTQTSTVTRGISHSASSSSSSSSSSSGTQTSTVTRGISRSASSSSSSSSSSSMTGTSTATGTVSCIPPDPGVFGSYTNSAYVNEASKSVLNAADSLPQGDLTVDTEIMIAAPFDPEGVYLQGPQCNDEGDTCVTKVNAGVQPNATEQIWNWLLLNVSFEILLGYSTNPLLLNVSSLSGGSVYIGVYVDILLEEARRRLREKAADAAAVVFFTNKEPLGLAAEKTPTSTAVSTHVVR